MWDTCRVVYTLDYFKQFNHVSSISSVLTTYVTASKMQWAYLQGGPKKWGHRLMTIILSYLNRFLKKFTERFVVKWFPIKDDVVAEN